MIAVHEYLGRCQAATSKGRQTFLTTHQPSAPQDDEMVARMLLFRKNMLSVLHNSFASHADFAQALKEGKACGNR